MRSPSLLAEISRLEDNTRTAIACAQSGNVNDARRYSGRCLKIFKRLMLRAQSEENAVYQRLAKDRLTAVLVDLRSAGMRYGKRTG
jgi:hypothetical protein